MSIITRQTLTTPDGGTIYLDHGYASAPIDRPCHLVTCGLYFATPEEAQSWVNAHWNDPAPVEDRTYAMAEARFGEYEGEG
jgi:hypothetical protein